MERLLQERGVCDKREGVYVRDVIIVQEII